MATTGSLDQEEPPEPPADERPTPQEPSRRGVLVVDAFALRTIPASAGSTCPSACSTLVIQDHPRRREVDTGAACVPAPRGRGVDLDQRLKHAAQIRPSPPARDRLGFRRA